MGFPNKKTSQKQLDDLLEFLCVEESRDCTDLEVLEGIRREVRTYALQRSRPLRNKGLKDAKGVCEACGKDYSKVLDGRGVRVLQVHHRKQLALNDVPVLTRAEDLAVVCANCHALIHTNPRKAIPVEELHKLLVADTA